MSRISRQARRRERKIRNREKDRSYKKLAWDEGKLISENHNNKTYSPRYSIDLGERLWDLFKGDWESQDDLVWTLRKYKEKIQSWLILYSPDIEKGDTWGYFKNLLDCYWDEPDNLLNYDRQWKANKNS